MVTIEQNEQNEPKKKTKKKKKTFFLFSLLYFSPLHLQAEKGDAPQPHHQPFSTFEEWERRGEREKGSREENKETGVLNE